jgi:hypothetical protein
MADYSTTTGILQPQVGKSGDILLKFEHKNGGGGAIWQRTLLLKIFYAQMIKNFAKAICHFIESYRTAKKVS